MKRLFHLTSVARHMRDQAVIDDDKLLYMTGLLVQVVQERENRGETDQQLLEVANAVARAWIQRDTSTVEEVAQ